MSALPGNVSTIAAHPLNQDIRPTRFGQKAPKIAYRPRTAIVEKAIGHFGISRSSVLADHLVSGARAGNAEPSALPDPGYAVVQLGQQVRSVTQNCHEGVGVGMAIHEWPTAPSPVTSAAPAVSAKAWASSPPLSAPISIWVVPLQL
jgi:hypothetical protein